MSDSVYEGAEECRKLTEMLVNGNVAIIKGSWFFPSFVDRMEPMRMRQDLPAGAVVTRGLDELAKEFHGVNVISHGWLHPTHPDPDGFRRRVFVKEPLKQAKFRSSKLFWDYMSLYQVRWWKEGQSKDYTAVNDKGFRYFPREPQMETQFQEALMNMHLIYTNPLWVVVRLEDVPSASKTYDVRGWCFFEKSVSSIGTLGSVGIDASYEGKTAVPLLPEVFKQELEKRTFTNGKSDQATVAELYANFFGTMASSKPEFRFYRWSFTEAEQFVEALQSDSFSCLRHIEFFSHTMASAEKLRLQQELEDLSSWVTHDDEGFCYLAFEKH